MTYLTFVGLDILKVRLVLHEMGADLRQVDRLLALIVGH